MTIQTLQERIANLIEQNGIDARTRSYSGRGMMGRECFAIAGPESALRDVLTRVIESFIDETHDAAIDAESDDEIRVSDDTRNTCMEQADMLLRYSADNLGYDKVYYWSRLDALPKAD